MITPRLSAQLITTIAGNSTPGFSGDGGPALFAQFNIPVAICFDAAGNMFVADYGNQRVRKIDAQTGLTSTIAGNGMTGFSGDGGLAVNAQLDHPAWVLADNLNHLYITDLNNLRVRQVNLTTGIITTVAGNGTENYVNGARADQTGMLPFALAFDRDDNLHISQHPGPFVSYTTNIISRVDKLTGVVTTIAGNGQFTFAGDGGPALQASLFFPMGMCFDASNNLYVADNLNQRIRKIDAISGIITTVAGDGSGNRNPPDGSLAINVGLANPTDVKTDPVGNLIFVDFNDLRIRKVTVATGTMTTIAGTGSFGLGSDCVPPVSTALGGPRVAAFDSKGNLCFTDQDFHRIRSIISGTAPTISISPSTSDVCLQNVVTFSANSTGTNGQSVYQWKKNGVNVGTNNSTYTDTFSKNDVVVCMLTAGTCGNAQITSNSYTLTGTFEVTPVVAMESTATEICVGTTITFTATNVSGSLNPGFEWYVNNQMVASGTTVFSTNSLANSDTVQCLMRVTHCSVGTTKALSNSVTVKVYTTLHPAITVQASSSDICRGTPVRFKATVLQSGNSPVYQWKVNGNSVGVDSSEFETAALAEADLVTCEMTTAASNTCLPVQTVISNQVIMKVQEPINPTLKIEALQSEICQGDSIQILAISTPVLLEPEFKWQVNNASVAGTNLFTINNPANGDQVTCSINIAGCTLSPTITSNQITLSVNPLPVVNLSPADTTVAAGTELQLKATVSGTDFIYNWSPADKLQSSTTLNPVTLPVQIPAKFQIHVISAKGCSTTKEVIIKVITKFYMPAAFTPNSDGRNDLFRIPPSVSFHLEAFSISDRWGNRIFTTSNAGTGWDGTYKGIPLESNVFIYMITGRDSQGIVKQNGTVVLIR
ncbi:MAG: T9SS type B sorting domain-containing protein [Ferruginibacter sp.]